jgi:hypothetical protein
MEDKQADSEPTQETQPGVGIGQGEQFQNDLSSSQLLSADLTASSDVEQQNVTLPEAREASSVEMASG